MKDNEDKYAIKFGNAVSQTQCLSENKISEFSKKSHNFKPCCTED